MKSVIPRIGVLSMFTMMSSTLKSAAAGESGSTYRTPRPSLTGNALWNARYGVTSTPPTPRYPGSCRSPNTTNRLAPSKTVLISSAKLAPCPTSMVPTFSPTTLPAELTNAPPLLPTLIAASVCIKPSKMLPFGSATVRSNALMTPRLTLGPPLSPNA